MREMLKLFVIVTIFSAVAGGLLASVRHATSKRIEQQELTYVKGPALMKIMAGCSNNPLADRFKIKDGQKEINCFVGEFKGKKDAVAFETTGQGDEGPIGVMVGFNLDKDILVGVGVTTCTETPGLGLRAKTDPTFVSQFKGMSVTKGFKVKKDGGDIDAISGATITSRGVCGAVETATEIYKKLKGEILKKIKAMKA